MQTELRKFQKEKENFYVLDGSVIWVMRKKSLLCSIDNFVLQKYNMHFDGHESKPAVSILAIVEKS